MGYSYFGSGPHSGKLCCDHCPDGRGYKRQCPFGFCPAPSLCAKCWRDSEVRASFDRYHVEAGCERHHAEFVAWQEREAAILAGGGALRCSALGVDETRTHVLFRRADRSAIGYYMHPSVYDAIPLLEPATPDDYRRRGVALLGCDPAEVLQPAPSDFQFAARRADSAAA